MVGIIDIYKSLNISIGTAMKNLEMFNLFLIILKLEKYESMQLRNYFIPDQYKTQKMCDKAILQNGGTLKSVPNCYKNQEMCNKAFHNYPHALEFVPECFMTQKNV